MSVTLSIKRVSPDAIIPAYATLGAACFDLHACMPGIEPVELFNPAGEVFKTGLAFEVPEGYAMLIFSRSGHGFKKNVRLNNCVGVIDSDYRGEVCVKLIQDQYYSEDHDFSVKHGDRIAQAMLVQTPRVDLVEVDELSATERGEGGFGSTGA